jgi:hypothetical protein
VPIRYTIEDARSPEEASSDEQIREEIERTGGVWVQMTREQKSGVLARLHDKEFYRRVSEQMTPELRARLVEIARPH